MDSNITEMITKSVKDLSRISRPTTNLSIWGGLGINREDGSIFTCKTSGEGNVIYGVNKNAYKSWRDGTYTFDRADLDHTVELLGFNQPNSGSIMSKQTKTGLVSRSQPLIRELTFFTKEAYLCNIDPSSRLAFRDGAIVPTIHEIQVEVIDNVSRILKTTSAQIVLNNTVDPEEIYTVPKGGGISSKSFDVDSLNFKFEPNTAGVKGAYNLKARIENAYSFMNKQENVNHCEITERDRPRVGDVWFNGLRTSIGNGIYELWADDIGAGPMLAASRNAVNEAAARYRKMINPINQRYATTRVNPMADKYPSNSITPVKMYVENWWEDSQLYAGIIAALFALMRSTGDARDSFEFSEDFIDAGAFDYDKLYKPLQGTEA